MKNYKIDKNYFTSLIFFIANPLLGFFVSCFYFNRKWFPKIIFGLFIFFGMTFVVPNNKVDSFSYEKDFFNYKNISFHNFNDIIIERGKVDLIEPLLSFFISRFTDDSFYLFSTYAFLFSIFIYLNLNIIYKNFFLKRNFYYFTLVLGVLFINPIWNINGIRYWAATNIFIYSILNLFVLKNYKRGIIVFLFLPLLHYSFIFPILISFAFYFIKKINLKFFIILAIFFSSLNFIELNILITFLNNIIPPFFFDKFSAYTDPEYVKSIEESKMSISYFSIIHRLLLVIFQFIFIYKILRLNKICNFKDIFLKYYLFILSFFSFLQVIPSLGRFIIVSYIILFILTIKYSHLFEKQLKFALSIIIFLFVIGQFYINSYFINQIFLTSNYFIEILKKIY